MRILNVFEFGFRVCFGFRISDFGFRVLGGGVGSNVEVRPVTCSFISVLPSKAHSVDS